MEGKANGGRLRAEWSAIADRPASFARLAVEVDQILIGAAGAGEPDLAIGVEGFLPWLGAAVLLLLLIGLVADALHPASGRRHGDERQRQTAQDDGEIDDVVHMWPPGSRQGYCWRLCFTVSISITFRPMR
jgi:hypothetical protein